MERSSPLNPSQWWVESTLLALRDRLLGGTTYSPLVRILPKVQVGEETKEIVQKRLSASVHFEGPPT